MKIWGSVKVPYICSISARWQWVFRIILQPLYLPVKSATHYAGQWVSSAGGVYIVANQGSHPDTTLSYSDQEHSIGSNAVPFGTYHHFGKWKLKLQVPPHSSSCATKLNGSTSKNTIILAPSATRTSHHTQWSSTQVVAKDATLNTCSTSWMKMFQYWSSVMTPFPNLYKKTELINKSSSILHISCDPL